MNHTLKDLPSHSPRLHDSAETLPKGAPFIVVNEAAERFSYYGMKGILVVFLSTYLTDAHGDPAPLTETRAAVWYHLFSTANYFFPVVGALISDIVWGKYLTIIRLSLVYCAGHIVLSLGSGHEAVAVALFLIAFGAGGIKPCASAHLGDQFAPGADAALARAFNYFYLAINIGGFVASAMTPYLLSRFGPSVAFGIPAVFMFAATFVFWWGRHSFIAVPPCGISQYRRFFGDAANLVRLRRLAFIYVLVAVFWALYDQTGSTWVFQAEHMNRLVPLGRGSVEILPSQLQALNPLLVLIAIPFLDTRPGRKFFAEVPRLIRVRRGMILTALSFVVIGICQYSIDAGASVSVGWQAFAYLVLSIGEILVSVTTLELAYTCAPIGMKSLVTSFYLLSVSLGNSFTALVNASLSADRPGGGYFLSFAAFMVVASLLLPQREPGHTTNGTPGL